MFGQGPPRSGSDLMSERPAASAALALRACFRHRGTEILCEINRNAAENYIMPLSSTVKQPLNL